MPDFLCVQRYHGSSRSLVRIIASKLPIDPGQRLHIQVQSKQVENKNCLLLSYSVFFVSRVISRVCAVTVIGCASVRCVLEL